jgi:hypothetical protein
VPSAVVDLKNVLTPIVMPFEKLLWNGSNRSQIKFLKIMCIEGARLNQHRQNVYLWPKISVESKRLAVTIVDIGKLLSSSDNFVVAVFFNIV